MEVQVCAAAERERFDWPADSNRFRVYLERGISQATNKLILNCETSYLLGRIDEHLLPITKNETDYANSYVCAPYGGAVSYPLYELRELPSPFLRGSLRVLIGVIAPLLRAAKINRVVSVNNWLLSTNLFPDWRGEGASELVRRLIDQFPRHAILVRSLNRATNPELVESLSRTGFRMVPSRQTYIFRRGAAWWNRKNTQADLKLMQQNGRYRYVGPAELSASDDPRIQELYDMLYLQKYTPLNPQFSVELLRLWRESAFLEYHGIQDDDGVLQGVVGMFQRAGVISAPVVGITPACLKLMDCIAG